MGAGFGLVHWLRDTKATEAPVWVPLASIFVSGAIVLWAARGARRTAHRVAREKATLELIEKRESTDYYISKNKVFSRLRLGIGFDHLHTPANDDEEADRQSVLDYLNHYELVALGIFKGTLDNDFYFSWMGTAFVRDWKAAEGFIWRARHKRDRKDVKWKYNPKPFQHFEQIACLWDPTIVPLIDQGLPQPSAEDAGPGDAAIPQLAPEAPALTSEPA